MVLENTDGTIYYKRESITRLTPHKIVEKRIFPGYGGPTGF